MGLGFIFRGWSLFDQFPLFLLIIRLYCPHSAYTCFHWGDLVISDIHAHAISASARSIIF